MQLIGLLVAAALVVKFWPFIAGSAAVVIVIVCVVRWGVRAADRQWEREQAERRRIAQLTARAEQQHTWVLEGDDRGVYGEYPPAAM